VTVDSNSLLPLAPHQAHQAERQVQRRVPPPLPPPPLLLQLCASSSRHGSSTDITR